MSISKVIQDRYAEANQQLVDAKRFRCLMLAVEDDAAAELVAEIADAHIQQGGPSAVICKQIVDAMIVCLEANGYVI